MTPKEFIEKAIEGGYVNIYLNPKSPQEIIPLMIREKHMILLDPKAWKAVGKSVGWRNFKVVRQQTWEKNMHRMIDSLIEGESIDDFLATL